MIKRAIWTILHSVRIQDLFDIAIVSVLIYGLLIWFKATASRFILVGIGILGIVYAVSRFFQFYLTAVVLQGFFAILLIALVVIFQEELRRFFERLALWGRIRKRGSTLSYDRDAEVIEQAVVSLSRKRIGALIVLKGEEPLDRHLNGGTPLEGLLSQPLLESIFDPHSVGHDGAAVIDRGRVVEFGCHLPLSLNSKKYGNFGLRHTAALGLSERADALCIVVSEERGTISVAQGERIRVLGNERELGRILERFLEKRVPRQSSRRLFGWVKKNPREKVAALLLASILWVVFGYQKESVRRDFIVPIEYRNLAPEWVIEEPKTTEAKVMLMGPEQAFSLLDQKTLKISLDLTKIQEGPNEMVLTREMVRDPVNLTVAGIEPDRIWLMASKLLPISVPVEVRTEGDLAPGLVIQRIEVTPASVTVLAPRRSRQEGIKVPTAPIDLKKLTATTTVNPKLLFPTEVRFIEGKPPTAKVAIEIRAQSAGVPEQKGN